MAHCEELKEQDTSLHIMIASEWFGLEQTFEDHLVQLHNFPVHSQGIFSRSFLQILQKCPLGGFCELAQPTPCKTRHSHCIKLPTSIYF